MRGRGGIHAAAESLRDSATMPCRGIHTAVPQGRALPPQAPPFSARHAVGLGLVPAVQAGLLGQALLHEGAHQDGQAVQADEALGVGVVVTVRRW
jgi:hypothetical protein